MELVSLLVSVTFWYDRRRVELIKKCEMSWKNIANCTWYVVESSTRQANVRIT